MADAELMNKFKLSSRYTRDANVWEDYLLLTAQYNPISLGQGNPDFLPPSQVIDALVQNSSHVSINQYTKRCGHPRLVKAISTLYSSLMNQTLDPYKNIVICGGAYGALHSSIFEYVGEGDEVIIIDPSFDCYEVMVKAAGGIPKYVPLTLRQTNGELTSSDWILESKTLEDAFNQKTKAIILNTPHNPYGKIFSKEELIEIANLCKKWNVLCISDEVYEWLVYEPKRHVRIATLPDMWERTITIGSAGKTFCITGWKIGWAIGPEYLIKNMQIELPFRPSSIQQEAVAIVFEVEIARFDSPNCHFKTLPKKLQTKKDHMMRFLKDAGMKPIDPESGIFIVADWTPLETKMDMSSEKDQYKDFQFTKWFTKNVGVLSIPVSVFYSQSNKTFGENFARFCFIKKDENLLKAEEAIKVWSSKQK